MAGDDADTGGQGRCRPDDRETYRALVEAVPDAVVLCDAHDVIRYVNTSFLRQFGYADRDDVVGQPLALVQPERLRAAHAEGARRYRREGVCTVNWRALETVARRRDGTEFPAEISMSEVQLGGASCLAGFIRDITRRKTSSTSSRRRKPTRAASCGPLLRSGRRLD